jgi:hypothetical protein
MRSVALSQHALGGYECVILTSGRLIVMPDVRERMMCNGTVQRLLSPACKVAYLPACRQIDDSFRREYAEFWHALVFQDVSKVRRHARNMNAGDLTDLFVAMITKKPWEHAQPSQQVPAPGEDSDEVRSNQR